MTRNRMRILAYKSNFSNSEVLIQESTEEHCRSNQVTTLFDFLLEPYENSIKVAWELDTFVAPIIKLLGILKCQRLHRTHKCYAPPYNVFYIPSKVFSITHIPTKIRTSFYELAQYYPELDEPKSLIEVQILAEYLLRQLKRMGFEPTKLTSPVAIYEECVLRQTDLPTLEDIPKEVALMAAQCMGRSWIEAHRLGHWTDKNPVYDYDLESAYSSVASGLADFRNCEWISSREVQEDAVFGFVDATIEIYDWVMVHPIFYEAEDGSLESRTGTWRRYCTKGELDFIGRWGIGEYRIHNGVWTLPPKGGISRPLKQITDKLLSYKKRTGLQAALAKRMSMFSGKFGEQRGDGVGALFNPVWKAEINTNVSLQVAGWLYNHGIGASNNKGYKHLLHISIDGALLDRAVKNDEGRWHLSYVGDAIILSSGLVFYADKKPKGLRYEDVLAMIEEHPNVGYYTQKVSRRVSLNDAVALDRLEDLGKEKLMTSSIDFHGQEHDREFKELPMTGRQLLNKKYKSIPKEI